MSSTIDFSALATPILSSTEKELSPSEILEMAQARHSKTVIQYQQRKRELPLIRDLQACRFISMMMKESEEEKKQVNRKRVYEEESVPESKRMKLEEQEEEEDANQSMDDLFNSCPLSAIG
uniref:Uncharacterized protein n=1 Tax=Caenorhabditis tropicalis TaxID=1561998 RepID=A0A1I7T1I6_9PELO